MNTVPKEVVNSNPHHQTGLIGYSILYSDGQRRGYWDSYDKAQACINSQLANTNPSINV